MTADGSTRGDGPHDATGDGERRGGRLRSAMLADGQQRFPWWLPLPGVALAVAWAAYQRAAGDAALPDMLLWPGAPIFVLTTLTAYLGWRLDLD